MNNGESVPETKAYKCGPYLGSVAAAVRYGSFEDVEKFAYRNKTHSNIIKKTRARRWYKEDLFARFHVLSDSGFIKHII